MSPTEVEELIELPPFVRTALVSTIRKICRREMDEFKTFGGFGPKPSLIDVPEYSLASDNPDVPDPPIPCFLDAHGFNHLKPVFVYIERPLEWPADTKEDAEFRRHVVKTSGDGLSPLELEIMASLPNCPTRAMAPPAGSTSYRDWVAFAARHAVLLLKKSPACPYLTRAQVRWL